MKILINCQTFLFVSGFVSWRRLNVAEDTDDGDVPLVLGMLLLILLFTCCCCWSSSLYKTASDGHGGVDEAINSSELL